jgi:hypothetical protein
MTTHNCILGVCFWPLNPNGPRLFNFPDFLTGLALMVLAWTIADVRYRFRIQTAPLHLPRITFYIVAVVGVLTLLTDLWSIQGWLAPHGKLLPQQATWQALLAAIFFLTFLTWTWFAFIKPQTFGKYNARRYARTLYRFILKGAPEELAVVADELPFSAKALIHHAPNASRRARRDREVEERKKLARPSVEGYANDILLLIADKRLCRLIVESSPSTALAFFQELGAAKKYDVQIKIFAKNIVNEALLNKDSFLYHEAAGFESGLIGYHQPLSQAMFANYQMVEAIGTMLDPDFSERRKWDADQWEAYCRIVLISFRDFVEASFWNHSFVLYRAIGYIAEATADLYELNGVSRSLDSDHIGRLRVVINFIKEATRVLNEKGPNDLVRLRIRGKGFGAQETFYDYIANMIFEVVFHASAVTSPHWECWYIQHNLLWFDLFNFDHLAGHAGRIVKFKLRRLLFEEVTRMKTFPNFKGARILNFCLNVMGLNLEKHSSNKDSRSLHQAILNWTRKNFVWLHNQNASVAEACLSSGTIFEPENIRLVKTYPAEGLRRSPSYIYLELDPLSA